MPTLSELKQRYSVDFVVDDIHIVATQNVPVYQVKQMEAISMDAPVHGLEKLADMFADLILEWDLLDEDGAVLPVNADNCRSLGFLTLNALNEKWLEVCFPSEVPLAVKPKPRKARSGSGRKR